MLSASPFYLTGLAFPALFIYIAGCIVTASSTRNTLSSLILPLIKAALFLGYYGLFFDGIFTFKDDWTYLAKGKSLLSQGISSINFFEHLPTLYATAGGTTNWYYYLYNADAFRVFSTTAYYAPVALNIALTFVAAGMMAAAARSDLFVSRRLTIGLFACVALYPDLVAWSTIMNGKDTLVMVGTATATYAVSQAAHGRYPRAVVIGLAAGLVLFATRFYVPLLLLLALASALFLSRTGRRLPVFWLIAVGGLAGILGVLGVTGLNYAAHHVRMAWVHPIYGFVRFILTPIPFHTTDSYSFLDLPQALYWALMPFLAMGVLRVWRRATLTARFIVIYFLLVVSLYAVFGSEQGPRHRYQLDAMIVVFQFFGVLSFLRQIGVSRNLPTISSARAACSRAGTGA